MRTLTTILAIVFTVSLPPVVEAGGGKPAAPRRDGVSMLVVPDQRVPLILSFDMQEKFPTIVCSYESMSKGEGLVHAWNGDGWLPLALNHFRSGSFLKVTPIQCLVFEDGSELPKQLSAAAENFCENVYAVRTDRTDNMVNALATFYGFDEGELAAYARQYGLQIVDRTPQTYGSWYDKPYRDETKERGGLFAGHSVLERRGIEMPKRSSPYVGEPTRAGNPAIQPPRSPVSPTPAPRAPITTPVDPGPAPVTTPVPAPADNPPAPRDTSFRINDIPQVVPEAERTAPPRKLNDVQDVRDTLFKESAETP